MKIWIDKHGGMHYHKEGCKAIQPSEPPPHFKYEEIEQSIRGQDIFVEGRRYRPCPFCFGYDRRVR